MADLIIALLILIMFSSIIGTLFFKVAYNNVSIRLNAVATDYAIKVAEYIDKIPYEEVENGLITQFEVENEVLDAFDIVIAVKKYNAEDQTKEDVIKQVNIKVKYYIYEDEKIYELNKLKIKEI